jgi:hypothetical protein
VSGKASGKTSGKARALAAVLLTSSGGRPFCFSTLVANMSTFSKLCLCSCQRSNAGSEATEASYTRIVDVKHASPRTSVSIPTYQAGHLRRPTRRSTPSAPLIDFDEKHLIEDERPSSSSQSSIVSVPSTHITILSSSRNGTTASNRQSYDSHMLGPPPSYHSRRTASPCPSDETIPEHPVMARDWLERLQDQALTDNAPARDGPALIDDVFFESSSLL